MILNPSHEITLRGLPSEVLDAYVRYKKGSRAIVSWLVQFGPIQYKGAKTLPIKELASLAASIVDGIKELPEVIHFHFRETIAARKRLSQYFRKSIDLSEDDDDTVNHEHFTASLTQIYSDLCGRCHSRGDHRRSSHNTACQITLAESIQNHYACLPVEGCGETYTTNDADDGCEECQQRIDYHCPAARADVEIENDEMSIAIETATTLEHVHDILTATDSMWEEAGRGEAHFVAVSGATNVAWSMLRDQEARLRDQGQDLSLDMLHQRCCLFNDAAANSAGPLSKVHVLLQSMEESERAVMHYLDCHKLTVIAHCPSCLQKPGDYIQENTSKTNEQTTSLSLALMDNILHLMCGVRPSSIILQSSPIFADIGYLLTHRDDRTTSFRCILGIQLLSNAYKAYLLALPLPSTIPTCRITALKLSRQACTVLELLVSNKDSFPCRCPETLAFHLANLKTEMDVYSKHKCWDLYFQSPWVSGNHIIEMLDTLAYYGMRLFHYRHYVGSILHSYNVLVHLAGLERIPLLEQLCETFDDVFFPAGRPVVHFKNSWARYIGARLKFKKDHKRHSNDKDSWCMAVPAHAARSSAGFGIDTAQRGTCQLEAKFDYARIDPMMRLKQTDWRADISKTDGTFYRQHASSSPSSSRPSTASSTSNTVSTPSRPRGHNQDDLLSTSPLHDCLRTLTASLQPSHSPQSTTSSLPTTVLSHLSIFHTSTTLIETVTQRIHTNPKDVESKHCICFAHTLLSAADRIVEGRRFGGVESWRKEERRVVEIVKACLEEVLGSEQDARVRKQWVWDI